MTLIEKFKLTDEQKPAATERKRDVSVSAGAGSGKTKTLVARYVSLLDEHKHPRAVVAITFTKKAAREMRSRIREAIHDWLAGDCPAAERDYWRTIEADIDAARIGTIHSLCEDVLRAHPAEARIDPRFVVMDEGESALLLAQAIDDTLTWASEQADLAPLFQDFETRTLQEILDALLSKRLDARAALPQSEVRAKWNDALRDALAQLIAHMQPGIDELRALESSGNLIEDANERLATQVQGLLAQWHAVESARDPLDAVRALYELRLNYCNGSIGKRTSRAKACVKDIATRYDECGWLDKKQEHVPSDDVETRAAESVNLLARLFEHALAQYQAAKDLQEALDFDDLEERAEKLLQDATIRTRWQNQIDALLVDEFQDTNERQRKIVWALAGFDEGKRGRLFIVGDAKQSIYRFRGADVQVFRHLDSEIRRRGGLPLTLDKTFRAHDALITSLNKILEPVMTPPETASPNVYVPFAPLVAERKKSDLAAPHIEILYGLGDDTGNAKISAAHLLAQRLREMQKSENVTWDQIALLFRASTGFPEYEAAFEANAIPFVTVAGRGFYERPEIRDLLNMLRALADPWDDLAMAGLLRSPAFGVSDAGLYQLRWNANGKSVSYRNAIAGDLANVNETDRKQIERARAIIETHEAMVDRVPVAELLARVLDATFYRALIAASDAGERLERNVDKLLADAHASGMVRVAEFLEYIESLNDAGAREGEAPTEAQGAVRLMTIHKAKGLEFPVVVIADASRGRPPTRDAVMVTSELGWTPKPSRLDPTPLAYRLALALDKERADAEDARLLYVAATRAKEKLIVCGNAGAHAKNNWLHKIADATSIDLDALANTPDEWSTFALGENENAVRAMARLIEPGEATTERCDEVNQSESPHASLFASIIPSPGADEEKPRSSRARRVTGRFRPDGTVLGTLVHAAIRRWHFADDDTLEKILHVAALEEGVVEPIELKNTLDRARELLARFRDDARFAELDASERHHEVQYSAIQNGEASTGYLDLLYRTPDGCWHVVDFKTDDIADEAEAKKLVDGKYGAQLQRYRRAVHQLLGIEADAELGWLNFAGAMRWQLL